ncbi:hypothetical protein D3C84_1077960 [compost metagenome]
MQTRQLNPVTAVAVDHHLHIAILTEHIGLPQVQHVVQGDFQRVIASTRQIELLDTAQFARIVKPS